MDGDTQAKALRRLKIIRGQVDGLERMVRDGAYCVDVLTQLAAVQQALRGVGKLVVRNHLDTCVTDAVQKGKPEKHYDELVELMYKLAR